MYLIKIFFLSPVLGFGIAIRTLPYLILMIIAIRFVLGIEVSEEFKQNLTALVNNFSSRNKFTDDNVLPGFALMFLAYIYILMISRFNRESVAQLGLADERDWIAIFVPRLRYYKASFDAWLFPLSIIVFTLTTHDADGSISIAGLKESAIDLGPPKRWNNTLPLFLLVGGISLLYFPLFGASAMRSAARMAKPGAFAGGFMILVVATPIFLSISLMVVFVLQPIHSILSAYTGSEVLITRAEYLAVLFTLHWSMMSAATARIFRRKLVRSLMAGKNVPFTVNQAEADINELVSQLRELQRTGRA